MNKIETPSQSETNQQDLSVDWLLFVYEDSLEDTHIYTIFSNDDRVASSERRLEHKE